MRETQYFSFIQSSYYKREYEQHLLTIINTFVYNNIV